MTVRRVARVGDKRHRSRLQSEGASMPRTLGVSAERSMTGADHHAGRMISRAPPTEPNITRRRRDKYRPPNDFDHSNPPRSSRRCVALTPALRGQCD